MDALALEVLAWDRFLRSLILARRILGAALPLFSLFLPESRRE